MTHHTLALMAAHLSTHLLSLYTTHTHTQTTVLVAKRLVEILNTCINTYNVSCSYSALFFPVHPLFFTCHAYSWQHDRSSCGSTSLCFPGSSLIPSPSLSVSPHRSLSLSLSCVLPLGSVLIRDHDCLAGHC